MQSDAEDTIIVVDDDPLVADVFMNVLLADLGPTICALTTEGAAELLAPCRWRLAIIDVMLPRRTGLELAALAVAMGTPVLLVTGDFRAAMRLQRYGYLVMQKPMAMDALIAEARIAIAQGEHVCRGFRRSTACMLADEARFAADTPKPGLPAGSAHGRNGEARPLSAAERSTAAHPGRRLRDLIFAAPVFLGKRAASWTNR